ncbi:MAG: DUF1538 domain-containing protein [Xanthomonadales bacterium]|nr:DUF1538 domain-containing protein [Xanthomonadales bacterium]
MVDKTNGARRIRYGDFVHESNVHQHKIRYADLAPAMRTDADGAEVAYEPARLRLGGMEILKLLGPYVTPRFMDQVRAVVPLAIYLVLFQLLILRESIQDSLMITGGLLAAIIGLMLFLEGLGLGLMPFGEIIGNKLPRKSPLWLVLLIAMILGIGVTFAEPAIGALQSVGSIVDVTKAPYLWLILNEWPDVLVLAVGAGVGIAAVIGTLRFLRGWSLKPCIYALVIPTLLLTAYFQLDPELAVVLGLAWDCGAVTTGPVTVPLVLSLGIGIAAAAGKGKSSLSGFGIVTLASLFPILAVLLLSLYVASTVTPEEILAIAQATESGGEVPWYQSSPMAEIIGGIRAIVPLVLFLFLVFKLILHETLKEGPIVMLGLVFCVLGMIVFNLGLTYGLSALGEQSGSIIPAAFTSVEAVQSSPLYSLALGVSIAALFAWILGFFATMAEPALNALGLTVENLTNGAFKKRTLMLAVSIGVGVGITLGVLKIIYAIPLGYFLLPGYTLGVILTWLSTEEFVNVAWDSAGVTTGPVTVPLVLAMGLGFGNAVSAIEGFGILAMASISPIISVLGTGIWVQYKARKADEALEEKPGAGTQAA